MSRPKAPHVGPSNASLRRAREASTRKTIERPSFRIDAYAVISRAVEEGTEYGWRRAHKHVDEGERATPEKIREEIGLAVLNALCEICLFPD